MLSGFGRLSLLSSVRGELRVRLFENRVLRRIFGSKKEKVTGIEEVV
jgi:hypothetical protein